MAETLLKYGAKTDLRNRVMEVTDFDVFADFHGRNSMLFAMYKTLCCLSCTKFFANCHEPTSLLISMGLSLLISNGITADFHWHNSLLISMGITLACNFADLHGHSQGSFSYWIIFLTFTTIAIWWFILIANFINNIYPDQTTP